MTYKEFYAMNNPNAARSARELAEQKYSTARHNLLLVIILTVVNVVLLLVNSNTMLLFSATVPYLSVVFGLEFAAEMGSSALYPFIAVAVIDLAIYVAAWVLSKKRYGWMILALVMFIFDTIIMLGMYALAASLADAIIDVLVHIWVLYYLIIGVKYGKQLKDMPEPAVESPAEVPEGFEPTDVMQESTILRAADMTVKHRVFLEAEANGQKIVYRRVKNVNELVINGFVYADISMVVETPHELTAIINGHTYAAGINDASRMYIVADGEVLAKKLRLV